MDLKEIKEAKTKVDQALDKKRIKDALTILSNYSKESHQGDLIDELYNIEFTYKNMLKYTMEGFSDPERQNIYNHLITNTYTLSDQIFESLLNKVSTEFIYIHQRELTSKENFEKIMHQFAQECANENLHLLLNQGSYPNHVAKDKITTLLFNYIWTCNLQNHDLETLNEHLESTEINWHDKCSLTSAITLSLLRCYNHKLLLLLFKLCYNKQERIQMRAITGLLITIFKYDSRYRLNPEIRDQLLLLTETPEIKKIIQNIIFQFIRTKETEKISKKLKDEILPEVVKIHPKLRDKLDLDNMIGEDFMEDKNPDWQDILSDSPELMNKLEEITQWQMDGADVFMSTFKQLKHFPFFNTINNWFTPFFSANTHLDEVFNDTQSPFSQNSFIESIENSTFLCNSDKYSFFLSIPHMPQFQKEMMSSMFGNELKQMEELQKSDELITPDKKKSAISNQYIQDLYRFFKVHPLKSQFEDIFNWKFDFHNKKFFVDIFDTNDTLINISEYLFNNNHFEDALSAFSVLSTVSEPSHDLLQKQGYCYQQLNNFETALELYLRADFFDKNKVWNLKKIALCYRHLKNPQKALEYFLKAEKEAPDNLHTQASIGHCHLELTNYEEALKYYFKVEYLDSKNQKVWRPIAWCSFVLGKLQQAEKYYQKILVTNKNHHDLTNIGHVYWCMKQRKEALSFYQKSINDKDNNLEKFITTFQHDKETLIEQGVDPNDIPIMLDQLRYLLEE